MTNPVEIQMYIKTEIAKGGPLFFNAKKNNRKKLKNDRYLV
jgi:hypothetical protein